MPRKLTSRSSLENLQREAKRWLRAIRAQDPAAHNRLRQSHPQAPPEPGLRDVQFALAREHGFDGWPALRQALSRLPGGRPFDARVAHFLRLACLDWRTGGAARESCRHAATRLLRKEPALARASIHTAAACGELELTRQLLSAHPELASAPGGPRSWPPLLYLCNARLDWPAANRNAVSIARLLLDHGADPNVFYLGGNVDIHYTALTGVLGRGEEMGSMHPRARELTALLLERGADPHDGQVLYNVFADNTSRHLLTDEIVWLLELLHQHSIRRGHAADWADPAWPMFDMRGAPSLGDEGRRHPGARFMLDAAVDRGLPAMAEWLLAHGADPNARPGNLWNVPRRSLYQAAMARGYAEIAGLLARYGAETKAPAPSGPEALLDACWRQDRERVRALLPRTAPADLQRALVAAIDRDRADVVALLLDLGVSPDVEAPGHPGTRLLHHAAARNAVASARVLLQRGAEVDPHESAYDAAPIGWASYFGQREMVALLGRYSREVWALVSGGLVTRLAEVLRDDPSLARATHPEAGTLLHRLPDDDAHALATARLLLEHGADVTAVNGAGKTAADLARERGMDQVADLLEGQD